MFIFVSSLIACISLDLYILCRPGRLLAYYAQAKSTTIAFCSTSFWFLVTLDTKSVF